MSLERGAVLNNRYRIRRLLGAGGMAYVYLAEDMRNGKPVAIKVLKRELNNDAEFVRRFETEARAASSLSHENIVKVLGVGEAQNYRYMVQEYVDGISLKEMIKHYGRLDWRIAVPMFIQIAMALANAHDGGVIHRDIKPHNIMVTRDHKAMVTDFGIARATTSNTITQTGSSTLGSVHYFSPEQARGGQVSAKSDLYSMGALMYETLTGKLPFDGDTSVSIAIKHLQETPVAPNVLEPTIPQGLSDIVMRCLRKNPAERYQDARELVRELDAFMVNPQGTYGIGRQEGAFELSGGTNFVEVEDGSGTSYEKVRNYEQVVMDRRSTRRRESGAVIALILLSVALVIGLIVFFVDRMRDSFDRPDEAAKVAILRDFTGEQYEIVKQELDDLGLKSEAEYAQNDDYQAGQIFEQNFPEGYRYSSDASKLLHFKVASTPKAQRWSLADFRGKNASDIRKLLEDAGLIVHEYPEDQPTNYSIGQVTRQMPGPESVVQEGDEVTLYVAQTPDKLQVPAVWGYSEDEIVEKMTADGFTIASIVIPDGDIAPYYGRWLEDTNGRVLNPGDEIDSSTQVKLIVGSAGRLWPADNSGGDSGAAEGDQGSGGGDVNYDDGGQE